MSVPIRIMLAWGEILAATRERYPRAHAHIRVGPLRAFPTGRDFAYEAEGRVVVSPWLALATNARLYAVLAHEAGHVVQSAYPAMGQSERDADRIGSSILRRKIGYDREGVQRVGAAGARPKHLPK